MLVLGACLHLLRHIRSEIGKMCRIERFRRAAIFRFITSGNRRVLTVHLLHSPALNTGIRLADMSHTCAGSLGPVRTRL